MQPLNYEELITAGEETFKRPQKVSTNRNRSREAKSSEVKSHK